MPAGYDAGHSLRIDVKWPDSAADFDLYVLDAGGREVAASVSSSDPETVLLPAVSASYTVRVVPYAPLGDSFTGTASLVTVPADPPPSTATPPTYANSSAPDNIADAHNAGEPSIGVDRGSGAAMFQAYTSTLKVTYDSAGAATWQDRSASAANGCPQGSTTSLDPILFTDPVTHRTFESQLAGKTALTCYTDDDGETWTRRAARASTPVWTTRPSVAAPSPQALRVPSRRTRTRSTTAPRTSPTRPARSAGTAV